MDCFVLVFVGLVVCVGLLAAAIHQTRRAERILDEMDRRDAGGIVRHTMGVTCASCGQVVPTW